MLHVEANEGGGAGGHAGLRLGGHVYHFEFGDGGRLQISRDEWPAFVDFYTRIENRSVHAARIGVSAETYDLLRRQFNRRYLVFERNRSHLTELAEQRRLLEHWAAGSGPRSREDDGAPDGLRIRAAGYFFTSLPVDGPSPEGRSAALRRLRSRIEERYGADALAHRSAGLDAELAAVVPEVGPTEVPSEDVLPPPGPSFARRMAELLEERAALQVVERAPGLLEAATVAPEGPDGRLDPGSRERLRELARRLEADAVSLFDSPRPDRGRALLVAAARIASLEVSLEKGRFVLLDTFEDGGDVLPPDALARRPDLAPRMAERSAADWRAAVEGLRSGAATDERSLGDLEWAGNRLARWQRAFDAAAPVPVGDPEPLPSRAVAWRDPPLPSAWRGDPSALAALASRARERERDFARRLDTLYAYDLVRHNCASEIFHTIDDALASLRPGDGVEAESRRRLGGYVSPDAGLAFVPFVSQWAARREYRVVETRTEPAWREERVVDMHRREPALRVALRESNTFTARSYARHPGDSFFVFFTDGAPPLRPLLGAVNLAAGLSETVVGLVSWPVDRGRRLLSGLKGTALSIPELFFVSIRKGTNELLPPLDGPLDDAAGVTAGRGCRCSPRRG